jgi:two-component system LytT family response regulator
MKILIIDDERDAREFVRILLEEDFPHASFFEAESVASGKEAIGRFQPDIALLDISMEDGTGFDLLDQIGEARFQIIFTTAHNEFAIKAFKYNALDYLLKPVDPEELKSAVKRAAERVIPDWYLTQLSNLLESQKKKALEKLSLPSAEGLTILKVAEIIRLESEGSHTLFYTQEGEKVMVTQNLKSYDELLPEDKFCRVHQSHLVNIDFVRKYIKEDGGYAMMTDGQKIPISRRKKDHFLGLLTQTG